MSIEGDKGGTRIARGEDGVNYKVPADMKYDEWKEKYVDKNNDSRYNGNIKINTKEVKNNMDIEIDEFTPCLKYAATGKIVDTEFNVLTLEKAKSLKNEGWLFDWTIPFEQNREVYKLNLKNSSEIQGLIAMQPQKNTVFVDIIEASPHNKGNNKKYIGVVGHLFAEAVKRSYDLGYEGHIYFVSKTDLIEYYENELGAILVNPKLRTMELAGEAALNLYEKYYGGER